MINVEIDETNVKSVINAFEDMLNNLDSFIDDAMKEIVSKGNTFLDAQYVSRVKDPNITDISTDWRKNDNEYVIEATGKDVIYEEFGTGDRGEESPHPNKSKYDLNDYNSGTFIMSVEDIGNQDLLDLLKSEGITSGKYWKYHKNGQTYLTQGVPAGQEMWDTRNYLIKEVIPKIGKKRGKELCEKFEKSIKN